MIKNLRLLFLSLVAMLAGTATADVTDVLTYELFASRNNQYSDFSDVKASSNAVYAGQTAAGNNSIQLRSKNNNSGVVTTASGGKLLSVTVKFNENTDETRVLQIYGSTTAYTSATDLYSDATSGTLIAEVAIANGAEQTITVEGDYTFMGFRSANGALYLDEVQVKWDGNSSIDPDPDPDPDPEPDPIVTTGQGTLESPYTVADALKVTGALESGKVSTKDYYIKGKISSIKYTFSAQYGTATFNISDDGAAENEFTCYSVYYLENKSWNEKNTQVAVGDEVIVYGKVTNYNGTLETASKQAYIYSLNGNTKNESSDDPTPDPVVVDATCAEIIAGTDGTVYKVKGVCTEIKNTTYGNWMLTDETGEVYIYGTLDANGQTKNFASLGIEEGDTITVQGPKKTYAETVELVNVTVLNIAKKKGGDDPTPEIAKITVNTALQLIAELEDSKTTEQEYQVEGYVTAVDEISTQYGNATFYIADAQGGTNVLKVYRAKNAVGEKITDANLLKVGDLVVVQGKLQKFVKNEVTSPQLASGGKVLTVNGAPTGITEISTNRLQKNVIYNLRGQRVSVAKKGLYIINGRKVFVK